VARSRWLGRVTHNQEDPKKRFETKPTLNVGDAMNFGRVFSEMSCYCSLS